MVKQLTAEGEMDQLTDRQTDRKTGGWTDKRQPGGQMDGRTTDGPTDGWKDKQAGRQG